MKPQTTEGQFPLFFVQLAAVTLDSRGRRRKPFIQRFLEAIQVGDKNDCWNCTGIRPDTGSMGYCRIGRDGQKPYMHRIAYELAFGPVPPGAIVMHKCDNPRCCNPHHLKVGSDNDNAMDKVAKGRQRGHLDRATVLKIDKDLRAHTSHTTISKRFGISERAVRLIEWGATWSKVTGRETPKMRADAKKASRGAVILPFKGGKSSIGAAA